ncbi:hypothetical protein K437DRAFT_260045 [Tilletiaria anomala UBC 951]|uniref:Uncharacterized protein n=1 Tax=Tilletiaria anomala (strain ATCC 24038 / CBS 436.72 / UBC 951) TaxID=1037660 RepID=A0A066VDL0_TILAU|nr:uncharacterized protein K437DRAFT_260045 [Tilletiaria anomala UBC 951]KDN36690.1 hypothetical protein K437DRAFT_260045 [Tilletiaria anomala UBC 951]
MLPALQLAKRGIPCAPFYVTRVANRVTFALRALEPAALTAARVAHSNVSNLFTPQGDTDPTALLPYFVGIWQSTQPDGMRCLVVHAIM